ncbi:membrane-spanning 4-domains subfamily A member 6E isoform X1 [Theropithecus gelada]|uniref:membrane-spanning 4-domains subfamily A member 6E isoform X1 n=1 Tax=Theropithecus gelada TaxID=9565 RepID=UPI000DC17740|nr:membrane-spanning 4-domains subfamily A member 6E isoform X1 [Theropithecus gelada]
MISQPVPNETVIVLPSNVINFSQAEKPELTNQGQGSLKTRLQAEVKVIGTIQILCGVKVLSLGIILASASFSPNFTQVISMLLKSAYPFIAPLLFVISGSLSIITEKRLTKLLVHSSLAGSILSALSALVGFILLSVNLAALNPASLQWNSVSDADLHSAGILPSCAHCCAAVETDSLTSLGECAGQPGLILPSVSYLCTVLSTSPRVAEGTISQS